MGAPEELERRREEDATRYPAHDDPERQAEPYLPEGDPPEPARIPEPWPPPDEGDRPDPERSPPDGPEVVPPTPGAGDGATD